MDYLEIKIFINSANFAETSEIIMAMLGEQPFESFDEIENGIRGFIPEDKFNESEVSTAINGLSDFGVTGFEVLKIQDQNWNKTWESNYSSVLIGERCFVRAPFHEARPDVEFEIVIEPKMSFGTAHHETTDMMLQFVLETDWKNMEVLDMGCGTGVLAILASKMGAKKVTAIDYDNWAYENSLENIERNNIKNVRVYLGGKELIENSTFDIVLANINRNILLDQIQHYSNAIRTGGKLFLSGFYENDVEVLTLEAANYGFLCKQMKTKNHWVALMLEKQK